MLRDASSIAKEEMQTKTIEIEDEVIKELYYPIRPMGIEDAKLKTTRKTKRQIPSIHKHRNRKSKRNI